MKLLFFTKGDASVGSSRQRVWLLAEHLKKIRSALSDTKYATLFVHKSLYPWDVILLILFVKWWWNKKLIYDLDDAEWLHSPMKSTLIARNADAIIAGSHAIKEWALRFTDAVILIPTVVDASIYQRFTVTHALDTPATIGWVGAGRAHFRQGNFNLIKSALEELTKRNTLFRFVIIGSQYYEPLKQYFREAPFPTEFVDALDWRDPASVPQAIKKFHFAVGLMPLVDSTFNRAKCALKAIEYMACGVPVVASNVGENNIVVEHGKTGFLAVTAEEWVHALETLLGNVALRQEMGAASQQRVRTYYSYDTVLPYYHECFNK